MSTARKIAASLFLFALLSSAGNASASVRLDESNTNSLSTGLVAYWPLDGNTTSWTKNQTSDLSGQGNTGTLVSMSTTTSPVPGKIGGALKFDGSTSYISTSASNAFGLSSAATLTVWVKTSSTHRQRLINFYRASGSSGLVLGLGFGTGGEDTNDGKPLGYYRDAGNAVQMVKGPTSISDGKWHLVIWAVSGTTGTLYVDGVSAGTTNNINNANTFTFFTSAMNIGAFITPPQSAVADGALDDVRIYNRALSAQEVQQLYAQGSANIAHSNTVTLTTGLVGYWPLDGNTTSFKTNTTQDVSGNGNTGSLFNMSTTTSPIPGKIGQALYFNDAQQGYIDLGKNMNAIGVTSVGTFSGWIKPTRSFSVVNDTLFGDYDNAGGGATANGMTLRISSSGTAATFYIYSNGTASRIDTSYNFSLNTWYQIVGVTTGSILKLYVNGKLISSTAQLNNLGNSSVTAKIGERGDAVTLMRGNLDDLRIYNRALSAQEVQQLYAQGSANIAHSNTVTLTTGLVGYWTFDGSNTNWRTNTTADSSGQGNTGTLVAMSTTTSPVPGKIGGALKFNGTNNSINVPNSVSLQLTNAITISAWIYGKNNWTHPIEGSTIVAKRDFTGSNLINYDFEVNTGGFLQFLSADSSIFSTDNTTSLSIGKWYFVSVTYDSSNVRFYVNGTQVSSFAQTAAMASNTTLVSIGRTIRPHNSNFGEFQGNLDDVRIYNRALSAQEVAQLYAAGI
jgi:hypothetical protein